MKLSRIPRLSVALAVGGAVFGIVTGVQAAIPDAQGVIHGCYDTTNGNVRVVDPTSSNRSLASCRSSEASLNWGQRGPTGAQGPAGPAGAQGPPGPPGSGAVAFRGSETAGPNHRVDIGATPGGAAITLGCERFRGIPTQQGELILSDPSAASITGVSTTTYQGTPVTSLSSEAGAVTEDAVGFASANGWFLVDYGDHVETVDYFLVSDENAGTCSVVGSVVRAST